MSQKKVFLRPPPPQSYADKSPKTSKKAAASPSPAMSCSPVPAIAARIPRRRPPKLMHVLKVTRISLVSVTFGLRYRPVNDRLVFRSLRSKAHLGYFCLSATYV